MKTNDELFKRNYNYCIYLLSKRNYSKKEISQKLIKREVDEEAINLIIEKLCERKYLSDDEYKEMFVKSKQTYKKDGYNKIKQDLYQKGISLDGESYDFEAEKENLKILVANLVSKNTDTKKIIARLIRKGYKFYDIKEALSSVDTQLGEDEEFYEE